MSTFDPALHPRSTDGRFGPAPHADDDVDLARAPWDGPRLVVRVHRQTRVDGQIVDTGDVERVDLTDALATISPEDRGDYLDDPDFLVTHARDLGLYDTEGPSWADAQDVSEFLDAHPTFGEDVPHVDVDASTAGQRRVIRHLAELSDRELDAVIAAARDLRARGARAPQVAHGHH